jgi:predicted nuclease with TOPRIM domain
VTRFNEDEIEEAFAAVRDRIAELEAENARLREALVKQPASPSE